MDHLSQEIKELETRLGEVAGELAELNSFAGPFIARYQNKVLRFHNALLAVQREIRDLQALRGDKSARGADAVVSPLNRYLVTDQSVQAQFERAWGGRPPKPPGPEDLPPASEGLKRLYTEVVAKLHPGLTRSKTQRDRLWEIVEQANKAYVSRDEAALQSIVSMHCRDVGQPVGSQTAQQMRERVYALEELIPKLESLGFELRHGDIARLRVHDEAAKHEGRDFLAELGAELKSALRQAHKELSELKQR